MTRGGGAAAALRMGILMAGSAGLTGRREGGGEGAAARGMEGLGFGGRGGMGGSSVWGGGHIQWSNVHTELTSGG